MADIDRGLYNTPKGFVPMLNFLSASFAPMLLAKQDPASRMLLLWVMLCSPSGSSIVVLKRVIIVENTFCNSN